MFQRLSKVIALGTVLACQSSSLWGAPCALIQVPTADVTEHHQGYIDVAATLSAEDGDFLSKCTFESCLGVSSDIELGFDGPPRTFGDGAFFFKKRLGRCWGGSAVVGVNEIGSQDSSLNPYVMFSTGTSPLRAHMGLDYADKKWRAILGAERALTDRLTLMADWVTGSEGAWSCGFNLTFGPGETWGLMTGIIRENTGDDTSIYVNLGRGFNF